MCMLMPFATNSSASTRCLYCVYHPKNRFWVVVLAQRRFRIPLLMRTSLFRLTRPLILFFQVVNGNSFHFEAGLMRVALCSNCNCNFICIVCFQNRVQERGKKHVIKSIDTSRRETINKVRRSLTKCDRVRARNQLTDSCFYFSCCHCGWGIGARRLHEHDRQCQWK